ncbi:MAG: hypothetical protein QF464_22815, partial [Myxococcota bacterium]|nr:hypothetical protein [Myxococcota bacterium]
MTRALEPLTPRRTVIAPGCWWLEPAAPKRSTSHDRHALDTSFAQRVLACADAEGFSGARIGIADGPVAATAATRVGGSAVQWIAPGEDALYLGALPVGVLPLSARTLGLLSDLGLQTVRELQTMTPQMLEARFGPEGRRAWQIAHGHDPRRPQTPPPCAADRVVVPLLEGCEALEPLLFALRPALERLVAAQAHAGRAIACLSLTLEHAWGPPHELLLTPSRALSDPELLLTLARLRLRELRDAAPHAPPSGPVVALVLEARRAAPQRPRQTDLFTASIRTTIDAEGALVRLTGRLGSDAVSIPVIHHERRPEQAGRWRSLAGANRDRPRAPRCPPVVTIAHAETMGCLRLLPSPRALECSA